MKPRKPPAQKMENKKEFPALTPRTLAALLVLAVPALLLSCNSKYPIITAITPKIGDMGEVITLLGSNFGAERGESHVTIAGIIPTSSSYIAWQDDYIRVKSPESGESGLIYVHIKGKKSNGVLFTNAAGVPKPIEGEELGLEPRITAIAPRAGVTGSIVTITGINFSASRESGGVFFTWEFESSANPFIVKDPEFIEVSETEMGYEAWNTREIKIRVPDGAVSGNLEIRTPRGNSQPVHFDVTGKPGVKTFKEKRSYTVSYSVDIRVLEATRPNTLFLWMPQPVISPSQRNVSLISRSMEPFVENHRGVNLFKLENLGSGANSTVNLSYHVEVYAQETSIRPLTVKETVSPLLVYTKNTNLIPSDDAAIKTLADTITGRERNPYVKARMIYDYVTLDMNITAAQSASGNIIAAAGQKNIDPCSAALLYTALARASGIPCIPVAGVLVNRTGQTLRHYWVEFWINEFGWIPADPAMGARAVPDSFVLKQDSINYFFGNLDSQRIAFSRGEPVLSQMDSRGRLVSHTQLYSLQNIWEEAAGGMESYSSLWGDVTITGIYIQ